MYPKQDRVAAFFREETPRRALALLLFVGLLAVFRHLFLLVIFFVVFRWLIARGSHALHHHVRLPRKVALAATVALIVGIIAGSMALGLGRSVHAIRAAREGLPERIAAIKQAPLFVAAQEHFEDAAQKVVEGAEHYASGAVKLLSAFGHGLLYALIGFILALIAHLEGDELAHFYGRIDPRSLGGIILRWMGHVTDALLVMVQFQLVVAACNAALTLPVLLLLNFPHIPSLILLIFVGGLVPVVGNVVSGAILALIAYQTRGVGAVFIFVGLTFVLHKLESYYLNPRLAARHVKLPGFVLVCSLILFEHAFGFIGLFLSFPTLFVAQRIRAELAAHLDEPADDALVTAAPASRPGESGSTLQSYRQ